MIGVCFQTLFDLHVQRDVVWSFSQCVWEDKLSPRGQTSGLGTTRTNPIWIINTIAKGSLINTSQLGFLQALKNQFLTLLAL